MASSRLARSRLSIGASLVEVVEDFGATRDPLRIILGRRADTLHQGSNPCHFGSPELAVLEIDIVDDLGDGAKRGVLEAASIDAAPRRCICRPRA